MTSARESSRRWSQRAVGLSRQGAFTEGDLCTIGIFVLLLPSHGRECVVLEALGAGLTGGWRRRLDEWGGNGRGREGVNVHTRFLGNCKSDPHSNLVLMSVHWCIRRLFRMQVGKATAVLMAALVSPGIPPPARGQEKAVLSLFWFVTILMWSFTLQVSCCWGLSYDGHLAIPDTKVLNLPSHIPPSLLHTTPKVPRAESCGYARHRCSAWHS